MAANNLIVRVPDLQLGKPKCEAVQQVLANRSAWARAIQLHYKTTSQEEFVCNRGSYLQFIIRKQYLRPNLVLAETKQNTQAKKPDGQRMGRIELATDERDNQRQSYRVHYEDK